MNQILATENDKNSNKNIVKPTIEKENIVNNYNNFESNGYNNIPNNSINDNIEENSYFDIQDTYSPMSYNKSKTNSIDSKKIILFFVIVVIVFGISIGGVAAYKIYKNKSVSNSTPEVIIEEDTGNLEGMAKISLSYKKGINKVIYYWNEDEKIEIPSSGENVEKLIELPKGDNTLTVILVDSDGNQSKYTKEFSYYTDKEKPVIELSIVEEDAKLKITATDETEMSYITYKWNEEEPITIKPEQEGELIIEETIDIKRGKNTLYITAVDTSNNEVTEEKGFNGVNEPVIDVYVKDGFLCMIVSHDIGIKKIEYAINDKDYVFDETSTTYEEEKTQVKRKKALKEGENKIEITVYSLEDTQSSYKGKYTYTPTE